MAADVDKRTPENGSKAPPHAGMASPGPRSSIGKVLWTLSLVAAVPLFAFGVRYYQDAQLLKRQVRHASVTQLFHAVFAEHIG